MRYSEILNIFKSIADEHFNGHFYRFSEMETISSTSIPPETFILIFDVMEGELVEVNKGQILDRDQGGFYVVQSIDTTDFTQEIAALDGAKPLAFRVMGALLQQFKSKNIKGFNINSQYGEVDFSRFGMNLKGLHYTFEIFENISPKLVNP